MPSLCCIIFSVYSVAVYLIILWSTVLGSEGCWAYIMNTIFFLNVTLQLEYIIPECEKHSLTISWFWWIFIQNNIESHMSDLRKLSSSLTSCPLLVSWFILNCLSLSQWLNAWPAHYIPHKNNWNQMCVNTMDSKLKLKTKGRYGYHHLFILHLFRRALWFMITYLMFFDWLFST